MIREDDKDFETSIRWWVCNNTYVHDHAKVKDYSHINEKYRDCAHSDCNINII